MEEASVLWVWLGLVVDELHLDGLHGTHHNNGLGDPGAQASENGLLVSQVPLLVHHSVLQGLVRGKPSSVGVNVYKANSPLPSIVFSPSNIPD